MSLFKLLKNITIMIFLYVIPQVSHVPHPKLSFLLIVGVKIHFNIFKLDISYKKCFYATCLKQFLLRPCSLTLTNKKIQLWKPTHHNKRFDIFRSSHEDIEPTQSCWTELTDRKLWSSGDIPTVDRVEATRNRPILSNDNDCLQQHLKFKDIAINFFDICRRYKEHHV